MEVNKNISILMLFWFMDCIEIIKELIHDKKKNYLTWCKLVTTQHISFWWTVKAKVKINGNTGMLHSDANIKVTAVEWMGT